MNYDYFFPGARPSQKSADYKRRAKNLAAREDRAAAKEAKIRHDLWVRCDNVVQGILALPLEPAGYLEAIPKLFVGAGKDASERYQVFQELDEKPARHDGAKYWVWHSRLRSVRNHPVHGRELFAVINSKGA